MHQTNTFLWEPSAQECVVIWLAISDIDNNASPKWKVGLITSFYPNRVDSEPSMSKHKILFYKLISYIS